ncbi:MAG TPA: ribosome-recycling factor, partial [Gammaproteobacteria bacterium]|nr:ribosome-recycling factor [Gammaproteobacteria bacterium]
RAARREALADVKDLLKEKLITEDEERKAEVETQKLTDKYIAQVDALLKEKEAEIMEV